MDKSVFSNLGLTLILVLAQVLVCNNIMLFNVAMAFVLIYVIIRLPMDMGTNKLMTWAFLTGVAVDMFADTPGVNSLACTILAMLKRPMLYAYIPRDDRTKNIAPSLTSLGFAVYGKYLFSMTLAYCLMVFSIEYFNFADIREILVMSAASSLLTFTILIGIDSIASK